MTVQEYIKLAAAVQAQVFLFHSSVLPFARLSSVRELRSFVRLFHRACVGSFWSVRSLVGTFLRMVSFMSSNPLRSSAPYRVLSRSRYRSRSRSFVPSCSRSRSPSRTSRYCSYRWFHTDATRCIGSYLPSSNNPRAAFQRPKRFMYAPC